MADKRVKIQQKPVENKSSDTSSSKKGYLKQNRERMVDEALFEIKDVKDYSVFIQL